jgi:2-hydroxychromene-2-carboxylate isomerase
MAGRVEVYFDCSSPWTYLAFMRIRPVCAAAGAMIDWKPILVGGVFNAVNQSVYETRANPNPRKAAYMTKDLADWARLVGVRIGMPPVFPVRAVKAMRGAVFALDQGALEPYAEAVFDAYWGDFEDISLRTRFCARSAPRLASTRRLSSPRSMIKPSKTGSASIPKR